MRLLNLKISIYTITIIALCMMLNGCANTTLEQSNSKELANINLRLGLLYLKQGNISSAKEKLLLSLKQNPMQYLTYDAYGYFLEKAGEPKQAGNYYLKALQIANSNGESANNYGCYLYRQKKYKLARTYFLLAAHDQNYLYPDKAYKNAKKAELALAQSIRATLRINEH